MDIFSFPRCRSIQKNHKCTHLRWTSFSIEKDGSCYMIIFQMEAPAWGHFGTSDPLRGRQRVTDQSSKDSLSHSNVDCEKQSEWRSALLDWALPYQLLFCKVKRYLLHLPGKWKVAHFGRDCYYSEVFSLALYFWLYVFMSAQISPEITALWLNDWNKWFQSIWG